MMMKICADTQARKKALYPFKGSTLRDPKEDCPECLDSLAEMTLWHKRLGHMSEKGLRILMKEGALGGMKEVHLDWCKDCLVGKQHRTTFKTRQTTQMKKLELIHSDVCGPMPVQSSSGKRYFVTFVDDATRKTWVYPLSMKD